MMGHGQKWRIAIPLDPDQAQVSVVVGFKWIPLRSEIDNSGNSYEDIICNLWSSFDSCLNNLSATEDLKRTKSGIEVTIGLCFAMRWDDEIRRKGRVISCNTLPPWIRKNMNFKCLWHHRNRAFDPCDFTPPIIPGNPKTSTAAAWKLAKGCSAMMAGDWGVRVDGGTREKGWIATLVSSPIPRRIHSCSSS